MVEFPGFFFISNRAGMFSGPEQEQALAKPCVGGKTDGQWWKTTCENIVCKKIVWFLSSHEKVSVEEREIQFPIPKLVLSSSFYPRPFCHLQLSCLDRSGLPCFRVNSSETQLEKEELETSVNLSSWRGINSTSIALSDQYSVTRAATCLCRAQNDAFCNTYARRGDVYKKFLQLPDVCEARAMSCRQSTRTGWIKWTGGRARGFKLSELLSRQCQVPQTWGKQNANSSRMQSSHVPGALQVLHGTAKMLRKIRKVLLGWQLVYGQSLLKPSMNISRKSSRIVPYAEKHPRALSVKSSHQSAVGCAKRERSRGGEMFFDA